MRLASVKELCFCGRNALPCMAPGCRSRPLITTHGGYFFWKGMWTHPSCWHTEHRTGCCALSTYPFWPRPFVDSGFFQHHNLRVHTAITWDLHQLSILHVLGSSQQSITLVSRGPNTIFWPLRAPALLCTDTCTQRERDSYACL